MPEVPTAVVQRCWASLKRLAGAKDNRGRLRSPWAAVQFTRAELATWLKDQAVVRWGWRCVYSGELLAGDQISLDHAEPRQLGGTTTLDNLRICTERMNRCKGNLTAAHFCELLEWMKVLSVPERQDLMRRLGQRPVWRGKRPAKTTATETEEQF